MIKFTQQEILNDGFWNTFKVPFKAVGGTIGAATKGIAKTLDYVAPELTQPIHRIEGGLRDIGGSIRKGWDAGYGGREKAVEDVLLDSGYVMDKDVKLTPSGKNMVAIAYKITGHDKNNNPTYNPKQKVSILVDKDYNMKIISTSGQNTLVSANGRKASKVKNRA